MKGLFVVTALDPGDLPKDIDLRPNKIDAEVLVFTDYDEALVHGIALANEHGQRHWVCKLTAVRPVHPGKFAKRAQGANQ